MTEEPEPRELVAEFYRTFSEQYRVLVEKKFGRSYDDAAMTAQVQRALVLFIQLECARHRPKWQVSELFATFGPMKRREEQRYKREWLVREYGWQGKPPKLRFAREMAQINADLKRKGCHPSQLWGSGTTSTDTMYDYVKNMLRQKKYRDIADAICRNRGKLRRKSTGGNTLQNPPLPAN